MAIKQNVIDDYNLLSGQQKAAILMLSLDEERSASLFSLMDDEEITNNNDGEIEVFRNLNDDQHLL